MLTKRRTTPSCGSENDSERHCTRPAKPVRVCFSVLLDGGTRPTHPEGVHVWKSNSIPNGKALARRGLLFGAFARFRFETHGFASTFLVPFVSLSLSVGGLNAFRDLVFRFARECRRPDKLNPEN